MPDIPTAIYVLIGILGLFLLAVAYSCLVMSKLSAGEEDAELEQFLRDNFPKVQ